MLFGLAKGFGKTTTVLSPFSGEDAQGQRRIEKVPFSSGTTPLSPRRGGGGDKVSQDRGGKGTKLFVIVA